MYTFIAIVIVIASILLTISVLLQNSKGGGLAANFTSGNETFGVRKTADILEKTTWVLAGTIFVLCVVASAFIQDNSASNANDAIVNNILEGNQAQQPAAQFPAMENAAETPAAPAETPAETPAN